jgi:hypothetical protein
MRNLTVLALLAGLAACGKKAPESNNKAGDISVSGFTFSGIAKAQAQPVLSRSNMLLKPCYKAGLAANENMEGVINLTLKVSKDGETYGVEIAEGSKAPKIHKCVTEVYRAMKVPGAGSEGGSVSMAITLGK